MYRNVGYSHPSERRAREWICIVDREKQRDLNRYDVVELLDVELGEYNEITSGVRAELSVLPGDRTLRKFRGTLKF